MTIKGYLIAAAAVAALYAGHLAYGFFTDQIFDLAGAVQASQRR
jgi:hypothetical protein